MVGAQAALQIDVVGEQRLVLARIFHKLV